MPRRRYSDPCGMARFADESEYRPRCTRLHSVETSSSRSSRRRDGSPGRTASELLTRFDPISRVAIKPVSLRECKPNDTRLAGAWRDH